MDLVLGIYLALGKIKQTEKNIPVKQKQKIEAEFRILFLYVRSIIHNTFISHLLYTTYSEKFPLSIPSPGYRVLEKANAFRDDEINSYSSILKRNVF